MITKIEMYAAHCDNCKEGWFDDHNGWMAMQDESIMRNQLSDDEWHIEEGRRDVAPNDKDKHYCPKCWSMDDEDNIVIDKSRFKAE